MASASSAPAAAEEPEEQVDVETKLADARRLQSAGSTDEAIEAFATVLEMRIEAHGEHDVACAPAYVEYAKALLTKAQAEGDPFGSGVCKKDEPADAGAATGDDDGDAVEGEEGEEGEAEADDLELSFQCLEIARTIYEKEPDHELALAEVLELLGEVQMENEMWAEAGAEFGQSLEIKKARLAADDRQLAHLHYQMGTAAVALMENARQSAAAGPDGEMPPDAPSPEEAAKAEAAYRAQAREAYEAAAAVLGRKLESMAGKGKAVATDEQTELEELLAEVRSKVAEHSDEPSGASSSAAAPAAEGVTTIGFGAPAAVTTIGFGGSAPSEGVTTIGFGAPAAGAGAGAVKNLGVVGGASGKKKAVIAPTSVAPTATDCGKHAAPTAEAMAPPARKRVRLDVEPSAASAE